MTVVRLYHYVFSSLGGYKTLYASNNMPSGLLPVLEAFARAIYLQAQRRELLAWLRSSDGIWCAVKAFPNGADHAGRSRSCVHVIVPDPLDASRCAGFSALAIPSKFFLSAESSLQVVANELVAHFEPAAPNRPSFGEDVSKDCVSAILSVMLFPHVEARILDSSGTALRVMKALAWALPRGARESLSVSAWAELPTVEGFLPARIVLLGQETEASLSEPGFVLRLPLREGENPVPFNSYAEYVASNIDDDRSFMRVRKLAALVERYPPKPPFEQPRYRRLMEAFSRVEMGLDGSGDLHPRRNPLLSLSAVKDFALAGMAEAALDILQAVVSSIESESGGGIFRQALERLAENAGIDDERFAEGCGFLAERLREFLKLRGEDETVG